MPNFYEVDKTTFPSTFSLEQFDRELRALDFSAAILYGVTDNTDANGDADPTKLVVVSENALSAAEQTLVTNAVAAHPNAAIEKPMQGYVSSLVVKKYTLAIGAEETIDHVEDPSDDPCRRVTIWKEEIQFGTNNALGLTPVDESWSTTEANLNDNNTGTLCYNNSQLGSDGKHFTLDAGEGNVAVANYVRWYDYTHTAYQPTRYKIQGSNNGTDWDDLVDITNPPHRPPSSDGHVLYLGEDKSYRYWRWLCVEGKNNNYVIVNELQLYRVTMPPPWIPATRDDLIAKVENRTQTKICNVSGAEITVTVAIEIPQ